jgi:SAM-dependent methyltransferase
VLIIRDVGSAVPTEVVASAVRRHTRRVSQNIYDDPLFYDAYRRLPRSEHGLEGAPEWPTVARLLPELDGRDVADLGCGFGAFARWAAERGARVDAFDLSQRMLARAAELTPGGATINYQRADLDQLELPAAAYDVAYSALTLHYLSDLPRLLAIVHRALRSDGSLVLTVEHPIYTAPTTTDFHEVDGRRIWPLDRYGEEGTRRRDWLAPGVHKQHRTFGTWINSLVDAGFTVQRVIDWRPSPEQIADQPRLAEEVERPMFLIVAAGR